MQPFFIHNHHSPFNPLLSSRYKSQVYEALLRRDNCSFPYFRDIKGHYGCVNALSFNEDGSLLISGSDDRRVLLWKFENLLHYNDNDPVPLKEFRGHESNIFGCIFDHSSRHIISFSNDHTIIRYDIEKESTTSRTHRLHEHSDTVTRISLQPGSDHVLLSSSDDQTILLWDFRCAISCQGMIELDSGQTCVRFHPNAQNFLSSSSTGDLCLWDIRNGLEPRFSFPKRERKPTRPKPVLKYCTNIEVLNNQKLRKNQREIQSCSFSSDGSTILTLTHKFNPMIYKTNDPLPHAWFSDYPEGDMEQSRTLPVRKFTNLCTAKSPCFAGLGGDEYIICGSDDFNVYMWKIPSETEIMKNRNIIKSVNDVERGSVVVMGKDGIVLPMKVSGACGILEGHRSIPNTTIHHPHLPIILSSGVEKIIKVNSAFPFPNAPHPAPKRVRKTLDSADSGFSIGQYIMMNLMVDTLGLEESVEEDRHTLDYFDFLVSRPDLADEDFDSSDDDLATSDSSSDSEDDTDDHFSNKRRRTDYFQGDEESDDEDFDIY
ncbi:WD40-repeat-containing domain protein [Paraphysoderma sedebokerense]|nr:WD40-repeat-containing domain protein [Paraphysoderma sedebokerense]